MGFHELPEFLGCFGHVLSVLRWVFTAGLQFKKKCIWGSLPWTKRVSVGYFAEFAVDSDLASMFLRLS